jgi:hypothetical protein
MSLNKALLTFAALLWTFGIIKHTYPISASTQMAAVPTVLAASPVTPTPWEQAAVIATASPVTISGNVPRKPSQTKALPPSRSVTPPKGNKVAPPIPKTATGQVKKPKEKLAYNPCSCVSYAQAKAGVDIAVGYAKNTPINAKKPQKGAILITTESSRSMLRKGIATGHNAYVEAVTATTITVSEANYSPCAVTKRTLALDSPVIRGYYIATTSP